MRTLRRIPAVFREVIFFSECRFSSHANIFLKNSLTSGSTILPITKSLTWYSCGPTVYDQAHLGHARTYICTDIIRRIMTTVFGKDILFSMGITDIDDKIILRGRECGLQGWAEIKNMTRALERDFLDDMDSLNVMRPDCLLRVTEHIDSIISYVDKILIEGKAYITADGVYFDVSSHGSSYGKLGITVEPTETCERDGITGTDGTDGEAVSSNSLHNRTVRYTENQSHKSTKRNSRDFALWKFVKSESEPSWTRCTTK